MSMTCALARFLEEDERLSADYSLESKEINVTEFLDEFLSSDYIDDFKAFEEDEEVTYKEIDLDSINSLSPMLDAKSTELLCAIKSTSGAGKRNELVDNLNDIVCLNQLIKKYYSIKLLSSEDGKLKLIVS